MANAEDLPPTGDIRGRTVTRVHDSGAQRLVVPADDSPEERVLARPLLVRAPPALREPAVPLVEREACTSCGYQPLPPHSPCVPVRQLHLCTACLAIERLRRMMSTRTGMPARERAHIAERVDILAEMLRLAVYEDFLSV